MLKTSLIQESEDRWESISIFSQKQFYLYEKYIYTAAFCMAALMQAQDKCQNLKINQIQIVGTHNSYAQPVDPKVLDMASPIISGLMQKFGSTMSEEQKRSSKNTTRMISI